MTIGEGMCIVLTLAILLAPAAVLPAAPAAVDLTGAVVVTAGSSADLVERQAASMLRFEVSKRTGIAWRQAANLPREDVPAIIVGSLQRMPALPQGIAIPPPVMKNGRPADEGYVLAVDRKSRSAPTVCAIGNDRRGTLYAVGRLLRSLDWGEGVVSLPADTSVSTAPAYPIRGMQLGYRATADAYDAWDLGQYVQYVRDLIVFGNNSIELIPSYYPGAMAEAEQAPLMPMMTWDMMVALSAVLDAYDMDVWLWLPIPDGSAENPGLRDTVMRNDEALFAACHRLNGVFVPGGDPGRTPSHLLVPLLKELAERLHRHHPGAGLWVSTQGFALDDLEDFYQYLQKEQPGWLAGIVYGPWAKDTPAHTREAIPAKYPIRLYPDVTHSCRSQYPIPQWDEAWHQAYSRQPIMPRPTQYARICRLTAPYSDGAIGYSDSVGDDVNKMVWEALLWDPKADLNQVLGDYGRYFVGPEYADGVADGLLMLERNWSGPAISNDQVPRTLAHWQEMEKRAGPRAMGSWRFQEHLLRAYADAYVQRRLQQESARLAQAYAELGKASEIGPRVALASAEKILTSQPDPREAEPAWRDRVDELAAMLFHSIGQQLSIEKYGANRPDRGALLDTIDKPLTDIPWLMLRVSEMRALADTQAMLAAIDRIVNWTDPGPGGFYDDLGNGANAKEPHLVAGPGWEKDPGFVVSAQDEHGEFDFPADGRLSWANQAETLCWTPLRMRYTGLDPKASYIYKAVPGGRFNPEMQLRFDGRKIGDAIKTNRRQMKVYEFEVPQSLTSDGVLEVEWDNIAPSTSGGAMGRGAQVAEAWLVRRK